MKSTNLWELNNRMEALQSKASILDETACAISATMAEGLIGAEALGWAVQGLGDIARDIQKELEQLTRDQFEIFKSLHTVAIGEFCE